MKQTWRWFGKNDPISLENIRQAGSDGIVSALHGYPPGTVWSKEDILEHKQLIEDAGLTWDVCESIWMSDEIKLKGAAAVKEVAAWKETLQNLGEAGVKTVCYNFMPVVDWTRTDLKHPIEGKGIALRFDMIDFVAYDVYVLKRPNAENDYEPATLELAKKALAEKSAEEIALLEKNIIAGLPGGAEAAGTGEFAQRIAQFDNLSNEDMRNNLVSFLEEVIPTAEANGISLAIHPDDPPFPLFGLPRIVSTESDLDFMFGAVKSPANGLTFCVGSFGARADNDLVKMASKYIDRIHFTHLRNVRRNPDGSFHEAEHLDGDLDMIAIVQSLISAELASKADDSKKDHEIYMRPDHGHLLAFEENSKVNPGYSYLGRLKGMAELRGVIQTIERFGS
ncbi:mannonate dehydratase [Leucothrix arctica]|uniref:Mannonate dehydratase n=1 Tax=Leucothrix arctica TaxID=1481894 RepID=A0A317CE86_9GAMM|nr:mannonate dehydratase [Leucothrix arctica]PWQ96421.1 mannonate dehydratase [Leucothrix arctica]